MLKWFLTCSFGFCFSIKVKQLKLKEDIAVSKVVNEMLDLNASSLKISSWWSDRQDAAGDC